MPGCLRRNADNVDVILDRLPRRLFGRLEQRTDIDVEADIGKGGGDHLGATIMAVLAKLHDKNARAAAFALGEIGDRLGGSCSKPFVALIHAGINPGPCRYPPGGG